MQVRMIRNYRVEGIDRRAGDFVTCRDTVGQGLIEAGRATAVAGDAPKPVVTPNRMKFASLVSKLDPKDPDFAVRVAEYQQQYEDRMQKVEALRAMIHGTVDCDGPHKVLGYDKEAVAGLKQELLDAIERFVVDRY